MKIIFNDGGVLTGNEIIVLGDMLSVDDIYDVAIADVKMIVESEDEEDDNDIKEGEEL